MSKKTMLAALAVSSLLPLSQAQAADYLIDTEGQHAFIQFKISHLGFSYILGAFEDFSGGFSYDPDDLASSSVNVEVDVSSLNSNHAERDKHILSDDFLDAAEYPRATFESTGFESTGEGEGKLTGELTLHGVTNEITMDVKHIGGGEDPWGGYRNGFEGTTTLELADYDIDMSKFPPVMRELELYVILEGIRQ
ncbi:Polyisoprenoid-binding protein YceI [Modicisalibacter ilicicola DSM 19980]|uniref:Polyisoprenoid-binding protein YceI n=1 Tax=Modicisalibacter ilicicola DSM 19980 TaxID=1121942 RepID=A0A1M5BLQ6_9GAMM|nr:YceI family protein [Halomonas ilicicola]SHF43345.1 Polyisoprenoid-binding protein YceI [Halomonas ilicicola DSM 19980]